MSSNDREFLIPLLGPCEVASPLSIDDATHTPYFVDDGDRILCDDRLSMRGALAISKEVKRRSLPIAIVGIPKTIDNDIQFIDKSFGFDTAYSKAVEAIYSAHNEAKLL